jgi:uncharacterized peroxidase-related enzyme
MIRPEVLEAWDDLLDVIKKTQDPRSYELATLAAAKTLKSSYCCLAHSEVLAEQGLGMDEVVKIMTEDSPESLSEKERCMMQFSSKVARSADQVRFKDVKKLHDFGYSDAEIFDIAATAAARSFFTKLLDALGVQPDSSYASLPEPVRDALVVGRPIEDSMLKSNGTAT